MKIFSGDQPITINSARACFITNQLATPGLGSLMGGRFWVGLGQIALAVVGFLFVMAWFFLTILESWHLAESSAQPKSYTRLAIIGALVFAVAWIWSLVTSIQLMREAKKNQAMLQNFPIGKMDSPQDKTE
jgi:hypothetical protein